MDRSSLRLISSTKVFAQRFQLVFQFLVLVLQAFAQFGSDLDDQTKGKIDKGLRIVELFKQDQYSPKSMQMQVAVLFSMQNGYFDDVDVDRIEECQAALEEYLETRKSDVLQLIADEKAMTDGVNDGLHAALKDFKGSWK